MLTNATSSATSTALIAIETFVRRRGRQVASITPQVLDWRRIFGRGLSSLAMTYRVKANADDGSSATYYLAYDPAGGSVFERSGLKRYANGLWFDAD